MTIVGPDLRFRGIASFYCSNEKVSALLTTEIVTVGKYRSISREVALTLGIQDHFLPFINTLVGRPWELILA